MTMFLLLQAATTNSDKAKTSDFWGALPSLLWFGLALVALLLLRTQIRILLENLSWRMRTGASIKLFSLELGQTYIAPNIGATSDESNLQHHTDSDSRRWKQREQYYVPN